MLSHFQNSTVRGHRSFPEKVLHTLIVDLQIAGDKTETTEAKFDEKKQIFKSLKKKSNFI